MLLKYDISKNETVELDQLDKHDSNQLFKFILPDEVYYNTLTEIPNSLFNNDLLCQSECLAAFLAKSYPNKKFSLLHIHISEFSFTQTLIKISYNHFELCGFKNTEFKHMTIEAINNCYEENKYVDTANILFAKNSDINKILNKITFESIPVSLEYPGLKLNRQRLNNLLSDLALQIKSTIAKGFDGYFFFSGFWKENNHFQNLFPGDDNLISDELRRYEYKELLTEGLIAYLSEKNVIQRTGPEFKILGYVPEEFEINTVFNLETGLRQNRRLFHTDRYLLVGPKNKIIIVQLNNKKTAVDIESSFEDGIEHFLHIKPEIGIDAFNRIFLKVLDQYYMI